MKYLAAYALLTLGGNTDIKKEDIQTLLRTVDTDIDENAINLIVESLKGKPFAEAMAEGLEKLSSIAPSGNTGGNVAAADEKEAEPEVVEEEVAEVSLGGGIFGDSDSDSD